jgi:hypothetical protein
MCLERVCNARSRSLGSGDVLVNIALRVDHDGLASRLIHNQVRDIAETVPRPQDFLSDRARGLAPDPNLPPGHWEGMLALPL